MISAAIQTAKSPLGDVRGEHSALYASVWDSRGHAAKNKRFSVNNLVNLTFEESNTIVNSNGDPVEGKTSGPTAFGPDGSLDLTVYVRPDLLVGTSQEFRAAVIMHELIHASFRYSHASIPDAEILWTQTIQHYDMLQYYISKMSSSLVDFFPGMSRNASVSLSLFGLGNEVTNSQTFTDVIGYYGMNRDNSSTDNWAYYLVQYQARSLGIVCN